MNLYDFFSAQDDNEFYGVYDQDNELVVGGTVENILNEVPSSILGTFKVVKFSAVGNYYKIEVR